MRLAVTLGDPRGVGPEVVAKAIPALLEEQPGLSLAVLGPDGWPPPAGEYVPVGDFDGTEAGAGRLAGRAIEEAVGLALEGEVDAIVTGPIHKPALHAAGYSEPGHTELLKRLTGVPLVGMLLVADRTLADAPLRVLLATTHVALAEVPRLLTEALLVGQATLLARSLAEGFGIDSPRVALCALNPHASDGGLFGSEEARIFAPAVAILHQAGHDVKGPFPADTVFRRALAGEFDAVVAPYHDVGMAAFKSLAFGHGVNVTLGLPFPRTSPDHGTAFDLAGRDVADPSSMLEALRLAARLARPNPDF